MIHVLSFGEYLVFGATNHLSNLAPLVAYVPSRRVESYHDVPPVRVPVTRRRLKRRPRFPSASPRPEPPERLRHGPRSGFRRADARIASASMHTHGSFPAATCRDCILCALEPSSIDDRIVTSKRPRAPRDFRRRRREVRAMLGAEIVLASMEREVAPVQTTPITRTRVGAI